MLIFVDGLNVKKYLGKRNGEGEGRDGKAGGIEGIKGEEEREQQASRDSGVEELVINFRKQSFTKTHPRNP